MILDTKNGTWGVCKNCNHSIIQIETKQGLQWLHCVPVLAQNMCNVKACNCGGNGFEIYGRESRNKKCGICGKGDICNCQSPEPKIMVTQNG